MLPKLCRWNYSLPEILATDRHGMDCRENFMAKRFTLGHGGLESLRNLDIIRSHQSSILMIELTCHDPFAPAVRHEPAPNLCAATFSRVPHTSIETGSMEAPEQGRTNWCDIPNRTRLFRDAVPLQRMSSLPGRKGRRCRPPLSTGVPRAFCVGNHVVVLKRPSRGERVRICFLGLVVRRPDRRTDRRHSVDEVRHALGYRQRTESTHRDAHQLDLLGWRPRPAPGTWESVPPPPWPSGRRGTRGPVAVSAVHRHHGHRLMLGSQCDRLGGSHALEGRDMVVAVAVEDDDK